MMEEFIRFHQDHHRNTTQNNVFTTYHIDQYCLVNFSNFHDVDFIELRLHNKLIEELMMKPEAILYINEFELSLGNIYDDVRINSFITSKCASFSNVHMKHTLFFINQYSKPTFTNTAIYIPINYDNCVLEGEPYSLPINHYNNCIFEDL